MAGVLPTNPTEPADIAAIISLSDIDTIKRARDYAEAIIETVREPLLVLDKNLHVKSANRSFYQMFQVSPSETVGEYIYRLGNGQWDIAKLRTLLEDVLPSKTQIHRFEVSHSFPHIGQKIMLLDARRVAYGTDGQEQILLAIEDITTRKESSEALLRTNIELEQFAYVASHDLQEPLRMVTTYMDLLALEYKGKLDEGAHQYIEIAMTSAKRMKGLVEDLLTFSRTGREGLNYERIDCAEVLERVLKDLKPAIDESRAEVTHDALPVINASDRLVGQIFQNLIANAVKFRGPRAPKVHISGNEGKAAWEFSVKDNGIGIEAKYKEKIFEIFQRLHGREKFEGTGIGLAMCKKIVERYGGQIWVESELGTGSTFHFTIPIRKHRPKESST